ncbi:hypothetical protein GUITHDRAFT_132803 [Guillardia theta CCMP2712]|uniref:Uncharacterized protein n=1 Tax=Guillardia theta (strain CCMP2712) TaxID=905079 RepID=L1JYT3_GUITC|nr:hypothetical protein GUITHDRAFT_132803 [Guillardia theta CCMP2712]EKX53736.1 hypothetical protein GUITHDRAFT_132803 [Guillardia theta CCMP2712]|eukprot:XP_005840716.1 hypothetical protein GUITHDRAFT_132803 [Guillardia theta CCMP2712]
MMSLKEFPSHLDSKPLHLTEAPSPSECPIRFQDIQYNEERIVYNPIGGEGRAYSRRAQKVALRDSRGSTRPASFEPLIREQVKGHRWWKNVEIDGVKYRQKMELKERKAAMKGIVDKLRVKAIEAKEQERMKLQERRRIKLENRLSNEKYQSAVPVDNQPSQDCAHEQKRAKEVEDLAPWYPGSLKI